MWGAVAAGVSALGSLIGGRKAAKEQRRAIAEQNAYNAPSAIRARAEEAGFNPLLFVGPGVGQQTALAAPVMGQAIQNAALAAADGLSEYGKEKAYSSQLEQQNEELRKALQGATLRPKVPGIYGTAQPVTVGRAAPTSQVSVQLDGSGVPPAPIGSLAFGDVPPVSMYAPYIGRNGQILQFQEGTDLEDAVSAVPLNALANLQEEGTIDPGFVDRYFKNAEDLATAVLRPGFQGAKKLAHAIVVGREKLSGRRALVEWGVGSGGRKSLSAVSRRADDFNPWR